MIFFFIVDFLSTKKCRELLLNYNISGKERERGGGRGGGKIS